MTKDDFGLEELISLLGAAFGAEKTEYFRQVLTLDPERDRGRTFVRRQDGTLAAAVQVFCRRARWGAGEATVGVIGNVATHPDHRGRGLAGSLVEEAVEWMRAGGFDLGLLFTGMQGFYERWGWQPAPYQYLAVPATARPAGTGELSVRRMETADLPALAELHRANPGADFGPFLRSPEYWRQHLKWLSAGGAPDPDAFCVASLPGQSAPVAYVRCRLDPAEGRIRVQEAVSAAGAAGYRDLLASLFSRARSQGLSSVQVHLPPGHPVIAMLERLDGAEWLTRTAPMLHRLGDRLRPPLAEARPFFLQTDWC